MSDIIIKALRRSVSAIDRLAEAQQTDVALQLRTLTLSLIEELERDSPDITRIESITEQVNQINKLTKDGSN